MPRETMITYEMVRDAANAYLAQHGQRPINAVIRDHLGGGSEIVSGFMKIWRAEVKATKQAPLLDPPHKLVAAYSADIAAGVAEQTRDLNEQLKEAQEDADDLRSDLGRTRADLAETQVALDKARTSVITLETQLAEARTEAHRMAAEFSRSNSEVSRLNKQLGALERDLTAERLKGSRLEEDLALATAARATLAEKVESLEVRLTLI